MKRPIRGREERTISLADRRGLRSERCAIALLLPRRPFLLLQPIQSVLLAILATWRLERLSLINISEEASLVRERLAPLKKAGATDG